MGLSTDHQVRLFRNGSLERLTTMPLRIFLLVWAIIVPAILWVARGSAPTEQSTGLFIVGFFLWSLTEYGLHRFLFHCRPKWQPMATLIFMIHGNHHLVPNDPLRNLMPLIVSLPLGGLVWAACIAGGGAAGTWLFAGWIIGYVAYDLVHYGCHQWSNRHPISGRFKTNHQRHHHTKTSGNYAITGMIWDRLFGTRLAAPVGKPR